MAAASEERRARKDRHLTKLSTSSVQPAHLKLQLLDPQVAREVE
jgi:hypothetical protein